MNRKHLAGWLLLSSCIVAPGCVCTGQVAGRARLDAASGCAIAAHVSAPLVVEWNGAARGQLEALRSQHVVAVRYTGCEMEILPACNVKGGYSYVSLTPKHDRVRVKDETELYANIPLHAASLSAKLQSAGELNVAMTIVGRYEVAGATVARESLEGDCARATHVIAGLSTGAFRFYAGAATDVGGGAGVGGAGGGGGSSSQSETLNQDGDDGACSKAGPGDKAPPYGCGAVIRLELTAIGATTPAQPTCPDGTVWDGKQCLSTQPPSGGGGGGGGGGPTPTCTAGGPLDQGGCAPGPGSCPKGTHHEGAGCAPDSDAVGAMIRVPGATFRYGARVPQTVATFDLDVTEVTVAQYKACVDAGKCTPPPTTDPRCNWGKDKRARHPINCTSWFDAKAYCEWAGKRLPMDIEWEYAEVGTTGWIYPWGNAEPDATRMCRVNDGDLVTCPVGSFPSGQSRFGILDMAGNVYEWMLDAHCGLVRGESGGYGSGCNSLERIQRGGPKVVQGGSGYPNHNECNTGFRCARTVPPAPPPRSCPAGTLFSHDMCIAEGGRCPPGMHDAPNAGCVPDGSP